MYTVSYTHLPDAKEHIKPAQDTAPTETATAEKTVIDRCVHVIYRKYFENHLPENMPLLEDLYLSLIHILSFDQIHELMAEKRQNARAEVEKAETPEAPEAPLFLNQITFLYVLIYYLYNILFGSGFLALYYH